MKHLILVVGIFAGAAAIAACGGSDDDDGMDMTDGGGASSTMAPMGTMMPVDERVTVKIVNAYFEPDEVTIPAGKMVELTLENTDGQEHDLQVEGLSVDVQSGGASGGEHGSSGADDAVAVHTQANETASITFMAMDPGTYEFYCTITGHKEAGMIGTLTVE